MATCWEKLPGNKDEEVTGDISLGGSGITLDRDFPRGNHVVGEALPVPGQLQRRVVQPLAIAHAKRSQRLVAALALLSWREQLTRWHEAAVLPPSGSVWLFDGVKFLFEAL